MSRNFNWVIWSFNGPEPVMVFKSTKPRCKREIKRFRALAPGKYKLEMAE